MKGLIHKKVSSIDGKELGTIESISVDYVEIVEHRIKKKHYFLPKSYIKEFGKKNLCILLTKNEVKNRYQRHGPPTLSEIQSSEEAGIKYHEVIPFMAKEPGLELKGEQSGDILRIPWEELIHKHVRTSDNIDIGDVDRIGNEFVIVRDGFVHIHIYYIPKQYLTHYDGSSLWIAVPSDLVSVKFERKSEPTKEEIDMLVSEASHQPPTI